MYRLWGCDVLWGRWLGVYGVWGCADFTALGSYVLSLTHSRSGSISMIFMLVLRAATRTV